MKNTLIEIGIYVGWFFGGIAFILMMSCVIMVFFKALMKLLTF